ncbi:hypothetical protein H4219_000282 [Mycoemilia scoparia]|uniref:Cyclin N-terminal domain-containing protein n=1 Tax=Mycoemilia scoparia TaxID=417184 RepID=A0A9W8A8U2_9FUNG|nr:hypothetical protein H4219_000282 [Mycoemilia scoparia]
MTSLVHTTNYAIHSAPVQQLADMSSKVMRILWTPDTQNKAAESSLQYFRSFCEGLFKATQLSASVIVLALFYVRRFKFRHPKLYAGAGSEYRMFTVSLMLASKYLEDNTFTTKTWSEVSEIPAGQLAIMQREFLVVIDHRLSITNTEYENWITQLDLIAFSNSNSQPNASKQVASRLGCHQAIPYITPPTSPHGLQTSNSRRRSWYPEECQVVPSPSATSFDSYESASSDVFDSYHHHGVAINCSNDAKRQRVSYSRAAKTTTNVTAATTSAILSTCAGTAPAVIMPSLPTTSSNKQFAMSMAYCPNASQAMIGNDSRMVVVSQQQQRQFVATSPPYSIGSINQHLCLPSFPSLFRTALDKSFVPQVYSLVTHSTPGYY